MKKKKRLPKGIRQYIRQEKARLRRQIFNLAEQRKQIEEVYKKLGLKKEKSARLSPPEMAKTEDIAKKKNK